MLKVKYYDDDHATIKEIDRVTHVNFYVSENIACVFYLNTHNTQVLRDIPATELITIEEV